MTNQIVQQLQLAALEIDFGKQISIDETNYKLMFEAGFNSGMQALSEGSTDIPVSYFYESFVEQFGLPKENK